MSKYGDHLSHHEGKNFMLNSLSVLIVFIGVIIFVVGFLGCCGAITDNKCMITTFTLILVVLFIITIVNGALGFAYSGKVEDKIGDILNKTVNKYFNETEAKELMDWAQQEFECCGSYSYTNYPNVTRLNHINPNITRLCKRGGVHSCYSDNSCDGNLFNKGCARVMGSFIKDRLYSIGCVALGIAFIELLAIIFGCCLAQAA